MNNQNGPVGPTMSTEEKLNLIVENLKDLHIRVDQIIEKMYKELSDFEPVKKV